MADKTTGTSGISGDPTESNAIDPASFAPAPRPAATVAATGTDASPGTGTDSGTRKRGRPPGSKNKANLSIKPQPTRTAPLSVDGVSAILFSIHGMLAGVTRVPELKLDDAESKQLASAIAEVAKHYDLTADPKMVAWTNLAMTAGAIYGTRMVAIGMRKKTEAKKSQPKPAPENNVFPFPAGTLPPMDGGSTPTTMN